MAIELEEQRAPGLPVVKRTALGQKFYGAVVAVQQRDRLKRDDRTGEMSPVLKSNNKARQELVVTALVLPGSNAPVGIKEEEHIGEEGELVRLILKGKAFGDWIEAKNSLGRGVNVGDIVCQITDRAQVYDAQGSASGPELTDQAAVNAVPRGRSIGIYGPVTLRAPKDGSEWVDRAEAAYHSLREPIPADNGNGTPAVQQDDPWSNVPPSDDEPPF